MTPVWRVASSLLLVLGACQLPPLAGARWHPLESGVTAHLRGLHVVDAHTIWASGSAGTLLRSSDGGKSFTARTVPGAESLELRDVHAFDGDTALFIACQPARIYRTDDGGATFEMVYAAEHEAVFLDALSFFDRRRGVAFGDPIDGRFLVLWTEDGGDHWHPVASERLPPALEGEGGFAASGTCLTVHADGQAWIGTGIAGARVMHSRDYGRSWNGVQTPMSNGASGGIFSLAFRDGRHGVAVGGDYKLTDATAGNAAITSDGGETWQLVTTGPPRGYRSCVAYVPGRPTTLVAVGEAGADYSIDDGRSWQPLGASGYHVVGFAPDGTGFAAGANGRMARLVFR